MNRSTSSFPTVGPRWGVDGDPARHPGRTESAGELLQRPQTFLVPGPDVASSRRKRFRWFISDPAARQTSHLQP